MQNPCASMPRATLNFERLFGALISHGILAPAGVQIAADRCTARNPGATRFSLRPGGRGLLGDGASPPELVLGLPPGLQPRDRGGRLSRPPILCRGFAETPACMTLRAAIWVGAVGLAASVFVFLFV